MLHINFSVVVELGSSNDGFMFIFSLMAALSAAMACLRARAPVLALTMPLSLFSSYTLCLSRLLAPLRIKQFGKFLFSINFICIRLCLLTCVHHTTPFTIFTAFAMIEKDHTRIISVKGVTRFSLLLHERPQHADVKKGFLIHLI